MSFFHDQETLTYFFTYKKEDRLPNKNETPEMLLDQFSLMQKNVINILKRNKSKFAFTVDAWSSKANKSYYGITIHYIDDEWKLNSTALDFIPSEGNHAGVDIAKIFYNVVNFFEVIAKNGGMTLDNVSANSTFVEELVVLLRSKGIDCDIEDIHFRCLAHVLNLGVQDILKIIKIETEKPMIEDIPGTEKDEDDEIDEDEENEEDENEFSSIIKKI